MLIYQRVRENQFWSDFWPIASSNVQMFKITLWSTWSYLNGLCFSGTRLLCIILWSGASCQRLGHGLCLVPSSDLIPSVQFRENHRLPHSIWVTSLPKKRWPPNNMGLMIVNIMDEVWWQLRDVNNMGWHFIQQIPTITICLVVVTYYPLVN